MYCDEAIRKVFFLLRTYDYDGHWSFFDCYFDLALYAAGDDRLVLQTDHSYITLGADGVRTWRDPAEFVTPGLELEDFCASWLDDDDDDEDETDEAYRHLGLLNEEDLYFRGEHLRSVTETEYGWLVEFDHLSLKLCPRTEAETPWSGYYRYLPCLNLDHALKRCACGGHARLMADHVGDYYISCSSCFRSTYGDYRLAVVAAMWNSGDLPVEDDRTPLERLLRRKGETVLEIYLPKDAESSGPDHFVTAYSGPILRFPGTSFELSSIYVPENRSLINIDHEQITSFSLEYYSRKIAPEEGEDGFRFISLDRAGDQDVMTLASGKREIVITAERETLDIRVRAL